MEDSIDGSTHCLKEYVHKRGERLVRATKNKTDNSRINRPKIIRKQKFEEK